MTRANRYGLDWDEGELDAIVADYFAMLGKELARRAYVKAEHRRELEEAIGRSPGSVEYKYQNISAVMEELGLPRITGYKPARRYQGAIFGAIDRYLSGHPEVLTMTPGGPVEAVPTHDIFVAPPEAGAPATGDEGLRRLVQKFDPVERDYRNRKLGRAGEEFVVEVERRGLVEAGRADLARRVRWIAEEEGDGAGYDVLSYAHDGTERLLEVKTTNGPGRTPFFLSRNEYKTARERADVWRLYRVHCFATQPRIFPLAPPLERSVELRPEIWRARLQQAGAATAP